jgi:DNA-binding NtrC family response regulator
MKARRSADQIRLNDRLHRVEAELSSRRRFVRPASAAMNAVMQLIERIAAGPRSPVLFLGETGVGKEILARHLHSLALGEEAPFIHINCAALPATTVESELFGHERGAFTDARTARRGLVEVASGGTLFLDEVGELPASLQAKLLTFLDAGKFRRLGGTEEQTSTARVVAATNRDLKAQVASGEFREDLWFRLGVFRIEVPSLRSRPEDIPTLADGILQSVGGELGRRSVTLHAKAKERLQRYPFPGNIRELRNILERALVLESGPQLMLDFLEAERSARREPEVAGFVVRENPITLEELERRYAHYVLEQLGGRRMEAAKALGLSYPTFLKRIGE